MMIRSWELIGTTLIAALCGLARADDQHAVSSPRSGTVESSPATSSRPCSWFRLGAPSSRRRYSGSAWAMKTPCRLSGCSESVGWPCARRRGWGRNASPSPPCSGTRAARNSARARWRMLSFRGALCLRHRAPPPEGGIGEGSHDRGVGERGRAEILRRDGGRHEGSRGGHRCATFDAISRGQEVVYFGPMSRVVFQRITEWRVKARSRVCRLPYPRIARPEPRRELTRHEPR